MMMTISIQEACKLGLLNAAYRCGEISTHPIMFHEPLHFIKNAR